ncbi:MAG: SCO family protein [Chitinophagia bacterium]|jgi:protein SCO1/2|nr:SCO family protein [Chitinophagia bacterium]
MSKKTKFYLLFFTILLLAFYYFVFRGTDNWKVKMPVLSYVQPFSFTNQDGEAVTDKNLLNKITVVEYFFTTCKGICPKLNTNMKQVYEIYKNESDFQILSHTCNPGTDSVSVLKHYSDSLQVNTKKWIFLTGRKDSLYQMARGSYLLDDPKNNVEKIEDQFIHTQFFALVDRQGKVRGKIYDGLKVLEVEQLKQDISKLLKE